MKKYPLMPAKIVYESGKEVDTVVVGIGGGNHQITVTSKKHLLEKKVHEYHNFWWVDYIGRDQDRERMSFTAHKRTRAGFKPEESNCLLFLEGEF